MPVEPKFRQNVDKTFHELTKLEQYSVVYDGAAMWVKNGGEEWSSGPIEGENFVSTRFLAYRQPVKVLASAADNDEKLVRMSRVVEQQWVEDLDLSKALDDLPRGSVVIDASRTAWEKESRGEWASETLTDFALETSEVLVARRPFSKVLVSRANK